MILKILKYPSLHDLKNHDFKNHKTKRVHIETSGYLEESGARCHTDLKNSHMARFLAGPTV